MFSPQETEEIRRTVYQEMARLHQATAAASAGSYNFLCLVGGSPTFTHQPIGPVIHHIVHPDK